MRGTNFDSTRTSLQELLDRTNSASLQLPDFQRGWVRLRRADRGRLVAPRGRLRDRSLHRRATRPGCARGRDRLAAATVGLHLPHGQGIATRLGAVPRGELEPSVPDHRDRKRGTRCVGSFAAAAMGEPRASEPCS